MIRAGHSCFRGLTWDCEVAPGAGLGDTIARLVDQGFVDESRSSRVRELLHPDEHRVILIPSTGRVQLRLHYLTPFAERGAVAQDLADLLARAMATPDELSRAARERTARAGAPRAEREASSPQR